MSADQVHGVILPTHPRLKAEALTRTKAQGHRPTPGMSDHEMGAILDGGREAPYIHPSTIMPPVVAPRRGWVLWLVLGLVVVLPALAGLAAR